MNGEIAFAAATCSLVTWVVVRAEATLLPRIGFIDVPNERSSHTAPRPRGGGVGILAGIGAGVLVLIAQAKLLIPWWLVCGLAIVAVAGLVDDVSGGIPVLARLLAQALAAVVVLSHGGPLAVIPLPPPLDGPLGPLGWPIAVLWILGVINIYNFLDGIDGYAGIQGLVAGMTLAVAFGRTPAGILGMLIAGSMLGFLLHNWHPARIFMGDVGSASLGFLFAVSPWLQGGVTRGEAVWFVAMALWFFLADGAWTLGRRVLHRERIWQAHREHLYQRLVRSGWSHSKVVLTLAPAMVAVAGAAAFTIRERAGAGAHWAVTGAAISFFAIYVVLVAAVEKRGAENGPSA